MDDGDDLITDLLSSVSSFIFSFVVVVVFAVLYLGRISARRIELGDGVPGAFDDEEQFAQEEEEALAVMDSASKQSYLSAKRWVMRHPPNSADTELSLSQHMAIQDKAVGAYEFTFDVRQQPSVMVMNKCEVSFREGIASVQTNLPLLRERACYYFEVKIYELGENTKVAVGVSTKPYPLFRLPGYHRYSVAYDSTGAKRLNMPFRADPYGRSWHRGDVVGVGYCPQTGVVFFTHNGKKLEDAVKGMTFNIFPTVGANGPAKLYVNFGQDGFVYIPANVNGWRLAATQGTLPPPPAYGRLEDSVLLESTAGPSAPPYSRNPAGDALSAAEGAPAPSEASGDAPSGASGDAPAEASRDAPSGDAPAGTEDAPAETSGEANVRAEDEANIRAPEVSAEAASANATSDAAPSADVDVASEEPAKIPSVTASDAAPSADTEASANADAETSKAPSADTEVAASDVSSPSVKASEVAAKADEVTAPSAKASEVDASVKANEVAAPSANAEAHKAANVASEVAPPADAEASKAPSAKANEVAPPADAEASANAPSVKANEHAASSANAEASEAADAEVSEAPSAKASEVAASSADAEASKAANAEASKAANAEAASSANAEASEAAKAKAGPKLDTPSARARARALKALKRKSRKNRHKRK